MRGIAALIIAAACVAGLLGFAGCGDGGTGKSTPTAPVTSGVQSSPSTAPASASVWLFFLKGETLAQVSRPSTEVGAQAALNELLKGPSTTEQSEGYHTEIPAGTRLNGFSIQGDTATADFSGEMRNFGGGSARVQAIVSQVENTVLCNDGNLKTVVITVDGVPSSEALQP